MTEDSVHGIYKYILPFNSKKKKVRPHSLKLNPTFLSQWTFFKAFRTQVSCVLNSLISDASVTFVNGPPNGSGALLSLEDYIHLVFDVHKYFPE